MRTSHIQNRDFDLISAIPAKEDIMSMEKQGVVNENTPPETPEAHTKKAATGSKIDQLADEHPVSRLIEGFPMKEVIDKVWPKRG